MSYSHCFSKAVTVSSLSRFPFSCHHLVIILTGSVLFAGRTTGFGISWKAGKPFGGFTFDGALEYNAWKRKQTIFCHEIKEGTAGHHLLVRNIT